MSDPAETGTCALCGQEMVRVATGDVWHPYYVPLPCPSQHGRRAEWGSSGRPGAEHFVPDRDQEGE